MPLFLGLDSGTQSTKAVALDFESGDIAAQASAKHDLIAGLPPGHLEQHPNDWLRAVDAAVAGCLAQLGQRSREIRAIGVSGQQHGLVALDANDQVVRPAKLWCDTSTAPECEILAGLFGGAAGLIAQTGNAIPPGFTAPKLLWLKRHEPENFARTTSVLLPHDYINFHLTGIKRMEYGDASGTGWFDVRRREWKPEILEAIDPRVRDMLPPLGSSLQRHGVLRGDLRDRWELEGEVVVSAGGGDNMMGAIGTGNVRAGVVTASLGTSGTLFATAEKPVIDERGEVAAFCSSTDQWLPLVCTMNVTVLTEHVRKLFGWNHDRIEAEVTSVPAGAGGLLFLPYLTGERTPNLPQGRGVVHGLRMENLTPAHLARAAVEGVTIGLGYGLGRFAELGVEASEIRLTGGGSKSAAWRQICADVFGVPVVCLATAEGAALGAAIQAAAIWFHESGDPRSISALADHLVKIDQSSRCLPQIENKSLYAELTEQFIKLTGELHAGDWI
ncbi:MAG: xylulokinase [Verrucomicrobiales bacterium]